MLEISISSEMAAEHPRFMAECLERGHRVEVFGEAERNVNASSAFAHPPERVATVERLSARRPGAAPATGTLIFAGPRRGRVQTQTGRRLYGLSDARRPQERWASHVPVTTSTPELAAPGPTNPHKEDQRV